MAELECCMALGSLASIGAMGELLCVCILTHKPIRTIVSRHRAEYRKKKHAYVDKGTNQTAIPTSLWSAGLEGERLFVKGRVLHMCGVFCARFAAGGCTLAAVA